MIVFCVSKTWFILVSRKLCGFGVLCEGKLACHCGLSLSVAAFCTRDLQLHGHCLPLSEVSIGGYP